MWSLSSRTSRCTPSRLNRVVIATALKRPLGNSAAERVLNASCSRRPGCLLKIGLANKQCNVPKTFMKHKCVNKFLSERQCTSMCVRMRPILKNKVQYKHYACHDTCTVPQQSETRSQEAVTSVAGAKHLRLACLKTQSGSFVSRHGATETLVSSCVWMWPTFVNDLSFVSFTLLQLSSKRSSKRQVCTDL